jgi:hypothetical protein
MERTCQNELCGNLLAGHSADPPVSAPGILEGFVGSEDDPTSLGPL